MAVVGLDIQSTCRKSPHGLLAILTMMMYSLAVIHVMPCIPTLTTSTMYECHVLNSAARYDCNACTYPSCLLYTIMYMLTPFVENLYVKFLNQAWQAGAHLVS